MRVAFAVLLVAAVTAPVSAVAQQPKNFEVRRERVNKVWDEQIEKIRTRRVASDCRAEAKKRFSAIRFNKRRQFVASCIEQARR